MKVMGICDQWSLDPPPELHFLNFYFAADPDWDPAVYTNADADPAF
jgi:hypothetical protein